MNSTAVFLKIMSNFPNRAGTFFVEREVARSMRNLHRGTFMQDTIQCPNCGHEIAVSETLTAQIHQHLRQEFDAESRRKDNDIANRADELRQREQNLEASRQAMEQEITARLAQEESQLIQRAQVKAKESLALEFGDLQSQLAEAQQKLGDCAAG